MGPPSSRGAGLPRPRGLRFQAARGQGPAGWPAVGVGALVTATGAGVALLGARSGEAPGVLVAGLAGATFALAGLSVAWRGLRDLAARRRVGRVDGAAAPWLVDHPWRREGALDETGAQARGALLGGGVVVLLASVVAAPLLAATGGPLLAFPLALLGLVLLVALLYLGRGLQLLWRRVRYGIAELRFGRFPFFLGEPLTATLVLAGRPPPGALTATLSCVVEQEAEEGPSAADEGALPRQAPRREVAWTARQVLAPLAGGRTAVHFQLPPPGAEAVGTALAAPAPSYWELEVASADVPGVDFAATFLVPVYRRPAPGRHPGLEVDTGADRSEPRGMPGLDHDVEDRR